MNDEPQGIDPERLDWDEGDRRVGAWMYRSVLVLLLACLAWLVGLGWAKVPLLGWPVAAFGVMLGLRVVKPMLRATLEDIDTVLDPQRRAPDTTAEEALAIDDVLRESRTLGVSAIWGVSALVVHCFALTLLWYGVGWLAGWVAGLF